MTVPYFLHIWGLNDGVANEDFDETTANYNTFAPPFDDSGDGTDNSTTWLFDGSPGGNAQALGTINVSSSDLNSTVTFSNQALMDFINADTNDTVTFLITRAVDDITFNSGFASKEHSLLIGPRLDLTYPAAPGGAIPEPMTMLAVGLGITSLGGYIRKRRRA